MLFRDSFQLLVDEFLFTNLLLIIKVRARNFPSAWGFVQLSQSVCCLVGVPLTGYINSALKSKAGYYFSAVSVLAGAVLLAMIDLSRHGVIFLHCCSYFYLNLIFSLD